MTAKKKFIVLDFETDGVDPNTCSPVQLAAVAIDPYKLEIIPDSYFQSMIRPAKIDDKDYRNSVLDTAKWHGKNQKMTASEVFDSWEKASPQKEVWENFVNYLKNYHTRYKTQNMFSAPIMVGYNIFNFDKIIIDRLSHQYKNVDSKGSPNLFFPRDSQDIMKIAILWFEDLDEPTSFTMDKLRAFLSIDNEGAHDALKDVKDEALIFIKFLKLHRKLAKTITFKGACAK